MSEFDYMHVIFDHDSIPVFGEPRTIEIDKSHDSATFTSIVDRLIKAGWYVTGVEINEENYDITIHDVAQVADALIDAPSMCGAIIAFGELFGWEGESFEEGRWGERKYLEAYHGCYANMADFAEQYVTDCADLPTGMPSYVEIDWEATADNLRNDFATWEDEDGTHVFSNNW